MSLSKLIFDKLEKLGKKYKKSGDGFIISQCLNPNHQDKHPSFSINLKTGKGYCFTCNYQIGRNYWINGEIDEELERELEYFDLLRKFKKQDKQQEVQVFEPPYGREVPDGWRGLSKATINKYNLYICEKGLYKNRVIFPFYRNKKLIGFNSRALGNETPKYLYSKGLDLKSLVFPYLEDYTEEVVITEGIMDALSLVEYGIPSVFNGGIQINFNDEKIKEFLRKGVTKLWVMLDRDKYGNEANKRFKYSFLRDYFEIEYAYKNEALSNFFSSNAKDFSEYYEKLKRR